MNTIHCQVTDGGWTSDDVTVFEDAFETMFDSYLAGHIASSYNCDERRYYDVPATAGVLGDPVFVRQSARQGSGDPTSALPPQVALTVTWVTDSRRHWGRIYLPGFTAADVAYGRALETSLASIATGMQTFGKTLRDSGQGIVVFNRASWTAKTVTELHIDDLWDVQRRRRFQYPTNRNIKSLLD